MLCYRCGSYNADGSRKCGICGQSFSAQRRQITTTRRRVSTGTVEAPHAVGARIAGRFRLTAVSGNGASGWVMRARDEEVDVDVALKLISPNLLQTEEDRSQFLRAVKQCRKLHHPNIVRIYEEAHSDGQVYYTMPFLEGLNLRKIVDLRLDRQDVFDIQETLPILGQLALGLDGLGKIKVHGALRPRNIIVLPDILKITGLPHLRGLPRLPLVVQVGHRGELAYLAPEARKEGNELDTTADVYSAAVIVGEMLTGRVHGDDPQAWESAARRHGLSGRVVAVLRRGVAERPAARYPNVTALFDALADAVGGIAPPPKPRNIFEESDTTDGPRRSEGFPKSLDDEQTVFDPAVEATMAAMVDKPTMKLTERHDDAGLSRTGEPWPLAQELSPSPVPLRHESSSSAMGRPVDDVRLGERRGQARRSKNRLKPGWAVGIALLGVAAFAAVWWWNGQRPNAPAEPTVSDMESAAPSAPEAEDPPERVPLPTKKIAAEKRTIEDAGKEPRRKASGAAPRQKQARQAPAQSAEAPKASGDKKPVVEQRPIVPPSAPEPPAPPPPQEAVATAHQGPCPADMIAIAGGSVTIGSKSNDPMRGFGDHAAHKQTLGSYCIDVFEFPNARGKMPVATVPWARARELCSRQGKRLCTEAEWEHACSGNASARFPVGHELASGVCNIGDGQTPTNSGAFGRCRSEFGVMDMTGNLAEWTASRWSNDIPDKVVRGGAAGQADFTGRCAARANEAANSKSRQVGFRCCADQAP